MRHLFNIFFLVCFLQSYSQEIIQTAEMPVKQASFSTSFQINYDLNALTICDTYQSNVEIDYEQKTIVLDITYQHFPICATLLEVKEDSIPFRPLMLGVYDVTVELKAQDYPLLDQSISLGTLEVQNNYSSGCNPDFGYTLPINCPEISNPVCVCSGKNFVNECFAFEDFLVNYFLTEETCGEHIMNNAQEFALGTYIIDKENFFASYDCDTEMYIRDEIFIRHQHGTGDTLELHIQQQTITLFLVQIDDKEDVICIDKSTNGSLINTNLEEGEYYIVVEEAPFTNSVTFLDSPVISSIQDITLDYQLSSTLVSKTVEVTVDATHPAIAIITSLNGSQILKQTFINKTSLDLGTAPQGMYILTLHSGQSTVTERLIKL